MFDVAGWYAKRRGSPAFVLGLLAVVGLWIAVHATTGFDHSFGVLNLCLSTEASVSLAFFTMMGDQQAAESAASMQALANTIDEVRAMSRVLVQIAESQKTIVREHLDTMSRRQ